MPKKRIAFYPAHPKHLWILVAVSKEMSDFYEIVWYLRDKDITCQVADKLGIDYKVFCDATKGFWNNVKEHLVTIIQTIYITRREKIDLWISKMGGIHIGSWLMRKKSVSYGDDDIELIRFLAYNSFPFANAIVTPPETNTGVFDYKTLRIQGNFEMFYLHPNRFKPDKSIYGDLGLSENQDFGIIRLVSLTAHHDRGIKGVSEELLRRVIEMVEGKIKLFFTSEKPLSPEFEPYRLSISVDRIHHALHFARFFLGDSQSMTTEAALLGTPAFRFNSFVGRISTMTALENRGLSFGFRPGEEEKLLLQLEGMINDRESKAEHREKVQQWLDEVGDPLEYFMRIIKGLLTHQPVSRLS